MQSDPSVDDYGLIVKSECGLEGILLKLGKDTIKEGGFEGMGLKYFREKFSAFDTISFFMPPVLSASTSVAIAQGEGVIISEDKICEICEDNLKDHMKGATTSEVSRRQQQEGRGGRG